MTKQEETEMHASVTTTVPHHAAENGCYLHGGGQRHGDRFIDTGVHIEGEGFLAICESCVQHLGKMLGLITPDEYEELARELADANDARVEMAGHMERLSRRNEALRLLLAEQVEEIPDLAEIAAPEPEEAPTPEQVALSVLEQIRAEQEQREAEYLAKYVHVAPEWVEGDDAEQAIARERAQVEAE